MANQIIWTIRAQDDRKKIFEYWNAHNKSTAYSTKLNTLIKQSLKLICKYPHIGKTTNFAQVRFRIIRNYFIFYKITDKYLVVLSIWDCNQDITKLKLY
jgi:addiction module RelE/StbE family toxin